MTKKYLSKNEKSKIVSIALVVTLTLPFSSQIYAANLDVNDYKKSGISTKLESTTFKEAFPDENFRNVLRDKHGFDKKDDDVISDSDVLFKQQTLIISNKGIKTLKGIEYFKSLNYLDCSSNELTELDVSKNISLEVLDCGANQLTDLNISGNELLFNLNCKSNKLTELNLSNNKALKFLYCNFNQLTKLDLNSNEILDTLDCNSNQLTDLNLSNNIALKGGLDCSSNQLTELNLSSNKSLEFLICSFNQLTTLDISNNTNLVYVDASSQVKSVNITDKLDGKYSIFIGELPNSGDYSVKELSSGEYIDGYIVWDNLEEIPSEVSYNYNFKNPATIMDVTLNINKNDNLQVIFNSNGGSAVDTQTIKSGKKVIKPENPKKSGNKFDGWYTESELKNLYNFDTIVNKDLTLYAKWKTNSSGGGTSDPDPNPPSPLASTVILASGEKYTDVLTSTVLASEKDAPILLSSKESVGDNTLTEINRLNPDEIIISGGKNSVSDKVIDQLKGYDIKRIAGSDRYETAKLIGNEIRKTAGEKTEAILVDGTNFPDAITASALASQKRVPILLTETNNLSEQTKEALKVWNISDLTIGGGYNSVSKYVESNLGVNKIIRLAGADRYETAEIIGDEVRKLTGNTDNMTLVNGTDFPDAITISSLSTKFKAPIMLTESSTLNSITSNKIDEWSIKNILIAGGYNSVSKSIEDKLEVSKKERVAGSDRYETAVKISQRLSNASNPIGNN